MLRAILLAVIAALAIGCSPAAPAVPDLDHDLSSIGLFPMSVAAPLRMTPEQVIAAVQADDPDVPLLPIRLGRRWAANHGAPAWVIVYSRADGPARAVGAAVDDQSGKVLFVFDGGSLRSFGVEAPNW